MRWRCLQLRTLARGRAVFGEINIPWRRDEDISPRNIETLASRLSQV